MTSLEPWKVILTFEPLPANFVSVAAWPCPLFVGIATAKKTAGKVQRLLIAGQG